MKYTKDSVNIEAFEIRIGKGVRFGKNIEVKVRGVFSIGDFSRLGDDCVIRGNNVLFGDHFYNSSGLSVGGGGNKGDNANLIVGDRCTFHNNFINVCERIDIGNDVGLSQDVSIITHGFWGSVLDGNPRKFSSVMIGRGVIVGYRTTILPGSYIGGGAVVGACSVVAGELNPYSVYAGNPARLLRRIEKPEFKQRLKILEQIGKDLNASVDYPYIMRDGMTVDCEKFMWSGMENEDTDRFRDELRKYGIRIYTERPFA